MLRTAAWVIAFGLSLSLARRAEACGGFFCDSSAPVVQTGEMIVFAFDPARGIVDVLINIRYEGEADEFAWVLPLQSAPLELDVVPAETFATIDARTGPRFQTAFTEEGICTNHEPLGFFEPQVAVCGGSCSAPVNVLSREEVGPYDSVVIESQDPTMIRSWLSENGYFVTDEMMDAVTPYLAAGDALLALRLRKGNDAGDIQPISVTLAGSELCVPLRLTAIAAIEDMDVTALVLSNAGRAIPENYNHVTLNPLKLEWLSSVTNYRSVVASAVDEGSGNAFVTEYAGDASIFDRAFTFPGKYDRARIEQTTTVRDFITALIVQNLVQHRELAGILIRHLPDSAFEAAGTTKELFRQVQDYNYFPEDPFDPLPATQEIWERIVEREEAVQALFDRHTYLTRLYTLLSPDEMMVDPTFVFDPSLDNVDNVRRATAIRDCGVGGRRENASVRVEIEETGWVLHAGDDRTILDRMPSALKVEQLHEGRVIQDNTALIEQLLEEHNARARCGCSSTHESKHGWLVSLMILAFAFIRRSAR